MNSAETSSVRIALLVAKGPLGNCVANRFAERFPSLVIIQEDPERKWDIIKRRARRLGWIAAFGQAAFGLVSKLGERWHARRRQKILADAGLVGTLRSDLQIISVPSANSDLCISTLLAAKPDVVAVYGTRLLGAKILASLDCPCINYHAGITPQYRGQHPAYWASANGEPELAGVTIHLVDSGVDTGAVLSQQRVVFSQEDTIWTYQWVQLAQALPLFEDAVAKTLCRTECGARRELTSCLYFPPTIWTYINNGLKKGVW